MPSYAILGATGQTGLSILLNILLESPQNTINAYVRSRVKLEKLRPDISTFKNVRIFEGDIQNMRLDTDCISNVSAVFAVVATNENIPNLRIAQETAHIVVAALCDLRSQGPSTKLPRIIFLSSASINRNLYGHQPAFVHWLLTTAFSNVYGHLALAEAYLRLHEGWLNATFVQPGGLVQDARKGHAISLDGTKPS